MTNPIEPVDDVLNIVNVLWVYIGYEYNSCDNIDVNY